MSEENKQEEQEKDFTRAENPAFFKLWDLNNIKRWKEEFKGVKDWYSYTIYAKTTRDIKCPFGMVHTNHRLKLTVKNTSVKQEQKYWFGW